MAIIVGAVLHAGDLSARFKQSDLRALSPLPIIYHYEGAGAILPQVIASKEYLPRQHLLRSLLGIELSILPVQLGYHNISNAEQFKVWTHLLQVQRLSQWAVDFVNFDDRCVCVRRQNVARVVQHELELGL